MQRIPQSEVGRASHLALHFFGCVVFIVSIFPVAPAQTTDNERPVPILTGNAGYFTTYDNGTNELVPEAIPVLLVPLGDKWLVEARAEFYGGFDSSKGQPYTGEVHKDLDYLQADYIANRYLTVTAGRFLTPFGIYNERLYPIWIRDLNQVPLIFPIESGSSDGVMARGGFPVSSWASLNYATYFSTLTTNATLDAGRVFGTRTGIFFNRPRIEIGSSWRKELMDERHNAYGLHFA